MLGHGEPIRVKQGERVLFRLLNASASMGTTLALPGHRFTVVALDGDPVPVPTAVDVLRLDVARGHHSARDDRPMPGTLTSRLQPASWCARAVTSPDKCSMR